MPTTATSNTTAITAVLMAMFGVVLTELEPNTASTDGASTTTPEIAPVRLPAIISQPVIKPRYGFMERPTHSNDAPQLAFHRFSRR